jgi:hypothetical protein
LRLSTVPYRIWPFTISAALLNKGGKSGSYEDWTFDDLRKRVKELGLSGYSGKNKSELVSMLRNH